MNRKELIIREDSIVYLEEKIEKQSDSSIILKDQLDHALEIFNKPKEKPKYQHLNKGELKKKLGSREEFKRPKTTEKILDEDHYLSVLETIIQRDYFPDLYNLREKEVKFF